jgi:glycosyltransferase involved in cell wall biosynthesis
MLQTVLHVSADFPDAFSSEKTLAVRNLIASSESFRHLVFSLNRRASPRHSGSRKERDVVAMQYWGLPYGMGLRWFMERVAARIASQIQHSRAPVHLIHAHKLSFEGIAAFRLSRALELPYVVTLRGNTDVKVLRVKPLYRPLYRTIVRNASAVLYSAPWALREIDKLLGVRSERAVALPNIVAMKPGEPAAHRATRFVTVFHLRNHGIKNLRRIAQALVALNASGDEVGLDVIGGGSRQDVAAVRSVLAATGSARYVRLLGALPHEQVLEQLPQYIALVLPSFPESFGLVYVEALVAGIPVLHARNAGIDGYFQDADVVRVVDHRDSDGIHRALEDLRDNQAAYKARVREMLARGDLAVFSRNAVACIYEETVSRCALCS